MTTPIDWITIKKLAEETGVSKSLINKMLDTGDIIHKKRDRRRNSQVMVSISSFNKYWNKIKN